jgi:hypothetical protein
MFHTNSFEKIFYLIGTCKRKNEKFERLKYRKKNDRLNQSPHVASILENDYFLSLQKVRYLYVWAFERCLKNLSEKLAYCGIGKHNCFLLSQKTKKSYIANMF